MNIFLFLLLGFITIVNCQITSKPEKCNRLFRFENDSLIQTIRIKGLNISEMSFELSSEHKYLKIISVIKGKAINKNHKAGLEGGGAGEDEDGNAYFINKYIYEETCWLSIGIDAIAQDKVTIGEAKNCSKFRNKYCPFQSQGILRKVSEKK